MTEQQGPDEALDHRLPETREPKPEVIGVQRGSFGVQGTPDTSGYGGLVRPITLPGSTARPYGGWFDEAADRLAAVMPEGDGATYDEAFEKVVVDRGELTFYVRRAALSAVPTSQMKGLLA